MRKKVNMEDEKKREERNARKEIISKENEGGKREKRN